MGLKTFICAAFLLTVSAGACFAENTIYFGPNIGVNVLPSASSDYPASSVATVYGGSAKFIYDRTYGIGLDYHAGKHRDRTIEDSAQGSTEINVAALDLYYTLFRLGDRYFHLTGSGGKLTGRSEAMAAGLKTTKDMDSSIYGLGFGTFLKTGVNLGFDAKYYMVSDSDFGDSLLMLYITVGYAF